MREMIMMIQRSCPHCRRALALMEELKAEHPVYTQVPVRIVDEFEEKAFADSLDYWYVPTYFVGGEKLHEGVPSKAKVQAVYEKALSD